MPFAVRPRQPGQQQAVARGGGTLSMSCCSAGPVNSSSHKASWSLCLTALGLGLGLGSGLGLGLGTVPPGRSASLRHGWELWALGIGHWALGMRHVGRSDRGWECEHGSRPGDAGRGWFEPTAGGRAPWRAGLVRSVGLSRCASRAAACANSRRTYMVKG